MPLTTCPFRNSVGQIVQMRYGEDGLDPMWVEDQSVGTIRMSDELFKREYHIDVGDRRNLEKLFAPDIVTEIVVRSGRSSLHAFAYRASNH